MTTPADGSRVLLRGGTVYSPSAPFATAMLVVDGVVAWLGEDDGARSMLDSADQVVDLDGRLVTPGFVDAHVHLAQTGFALDAVDLTDAAHRDEVLDRLADAALSRPLVLAHGWDETRWHDPRPPTRAELDRAVGDASAVLTRVDGHSAVVSTGMLARTPGLANLDGWSDDGRVERDAHHAVRTVVQQQRSDAERTDAIRRALRSAAGQGITSVHEVNAPHISPADDFRLLDALAAEGPTVEVVRYWGELLPADDGADVPFDHAVLGFAGDLNVDGAVGSRTAATNAPYADADTRGRLYLDAAAVRDHVSACTRRGLQAGFHVIGDRAMDAVTAGLRAAAEDVGVDAMVAARHRLEHAEMLSESEVATLAALGVVASVQPAFDAAWGGPGQLYEQRLGRTRAEAMNPFATMHRAGVVLAFGSDSPVTPFDPWGAVRAAAFHHRDSERLTVRAAFNAHTRGGHRARRADDAGVLRPGAAATYAVWELGSDLTVQTPDDRVSSWSTDLRAGVPVLPDVHPDADLPTCVRTVVAGSVVFATAALNHAAPAAEEQS